jgi:N-carbamoyl-L-amino-acid hydrolase
VTLAAEVRSLDIEQIERVWRDALATGEAACEARGVSLHLVAQTDAAPCAPPAWLHAAVLHVCRELNPEALTLPSGAGHDTMHLAEIAPAAMIFVPSIGGRSHCPEELTAPEHLGLGVAALTRSILVIDRI